MSVQALKYNRIVKYTLLENNEPVCIILYRP